MYEGDEDGGGRSASRSRCWTRPATIEGITATVVRDTVYVDGEIAEDTYDWFAQDDDGNVWYLGEDTHEYEDGVAVNAEGAWEYGKDGALPGIVMPAQPDGRRRLPPGVLRRARPRTWPRSSRSARAKEIGLGAYDDVVVTEDWTPLEPDVAEEKWYARGHRQHLQHPHRGRGRHRRAHRVHARRREQSGRGSATRPTMVDGRDDEEEQP